MKTVRMVMGCPASGKGTWVKNNCQGYTILNRDTEGGKISSLLPKLVNALSNGEDVVLDNTFPTIAERKPFIDAVNLSGNRIECIFVSTSIEDAQVNALHRMWGKYQEIFFHSDEYRNIKNPNTFPPAALFSYRKRLEKPTMDEGFSEITTVRFKRKESTNTNKAVIFDYDGTLRETLDGSKYPISPDNIRILPNRKEVIERYRSQGYMILGLSNQSGIGKGNLTEQDAIDCFERTNELIGVDIDYYYCKHKVPPVSCYCRKPQTGYGVYFIEKFGLNPIETIMVGDMTSDKTFAKRCGFKYFDQEDFFV